MPPLGKHFGRSFATAKPPLRSCAGSRCIVVGSHNWTENALEGYNLEAGVLIRCDERDSIVGEVRAHIDACDQRSERFERKRLRFYGAVQRDLHRGVGPGGQESEDFPGFEEVEALVIHAEDCTPNGLPEPVQLFVPVRDSGTQQMFRQAPRVLLYLYPAGTLIGHSPAKAAPRELEGEVTMTNIVPDAPVTARSATCQLDDLSAPRIDLLPGNTVPATSGELSQVVIRFSGRGSGELPVFHSAEQHPKIRLGVKYHVVDRDQGDEWLEKRHRTAERIGDTEDDRPLPTYEAPHHLTVNSKLRVPSQDLYAGDVRQQLTYVLTGSDLFDETTVAELELDSPAASAVLSRYVYRVNHRLTQATMARITKQLKLFRDV